MMHIDEAFSFVIAKFNTRGGYDEIAHTIADYSQRAEAAEAANAELKRQLEKAQNAARKFSEAHSNRIDSDGEYYPYCDPQDWAEFDLAFGIGVTS